jgi:hypothetical protein
MENTQSISRRSLVIIGVFVLVILALGFYYKSNIMQKFSIGETAVVAEVSDDSPIAFYKNPAYGYQFSYEKATFSLVQAQLVPPGSKTAVAGVKLIPADRAASLGKSGCTYGESGKQTTCNADMENGLFFGIVKADLETALSTVDNPSLLRAVAINDVDVYQYSVGAEGDGIDYYFWPITDDTTLVIGRKYTGVSVPTNFDTMLLLNAMTFPGMVKNSQADEAAHAKKK